MISEYIENIPSKPENYSNLAKDLKNYEKKKEFDKIFDFPIEVESFLIILTSFKLDLLSLKSSCIEVFYEYKESNENLTSQDQITMSEISVVSKSKPEEIIALKEKKNLRKRLSSIFENSETQQEKFFSCQKFDKIGRRPFLKLKEKYTGVVCNKNNSIDRISFMSESPISIQKVSLPSSDLSFNLRNTLYSSDKFDKLRVNEFEVDEPSFIKEKSIESEHFFEENEAKQIRFETQIIAIKGNYYGYLIIDNEYLIFNSSEFDKKNASPMVYTKDHNFDNARASSLPENIINREVTKI